MKCLDQLCKIVAGVLGQFLDHNVSPRAGGLVLENESCALCDTRKRTISAAPALVVRVWMIAVAVSFGHSNFGDRSGRLRVGSASNLIVEYGPIGMTDVPGFEFPSIHVECVLKLLIKNSL